MIRLANKFDIPKIVDLLRAYRSEAPWPRLRQVNNQHYIETILTTIIAGLGRIWLAEREGSVIGFLIAVRNGNVWDPDLYQYAELAYWVDPQHRGSTAGYRLLRAYVDFGQAEQQAGRIDSFTVSKMTSSPDLKYEKFGFSKQEESWRA